MFREFFYHDFKNWKIKTVLWISFLAIQCAMFSSGDIKKLAETMFKEFKETSPVCFYFVFPHVRTYMGTH